jgi:hypothetical protein
VMWFKAARGMQLQDPLIMSHEKGGVENTNRELGSFCQEIRI